MSRTLLLPALTIAACAVDDPSATNVVVASETSESSLGDECPVNTPAIVAPNADQELVFVMDAQGVQKYTCVGSATVGFAWTFVAPDADLFDSVAHGLAIHHFAGPSWLYKDSSSVVAARHSGVTVDATAIPWLLLDVTRHGGAPGRLSEITQIQRLATTGGLAPATGCDADHVGAENDVLYTARYFFYRATTKANPIRCGG